MAKKIKLPLEMANGVAVRTLDELKENWDLEKVLMYFHNGRLQSWLSDRYYNEMVEQVNALTGISDSNEQQKKLCEVFAMPFTETNAVDMDIVLDRNSQLEKLRRITADDKVLKNVDKVAFNQEELANLLDEGKEEIYLVNNSFSIPLTVRNKKYIGIGNAVAVINSKEPVDFRALNIRFQNIKFDEAYEKTSRIVTELEAAEKAHIEGRYKDAFDMLLKLAAKENGRAMYFLGEYFRQSFGNVVTKNNEIGFTWHKLGANRGDALAGLNVAYSYPEGSPESEEIFKKHFESVKVLADRGDIIAQSEIADIYKNGWGIEKDIDKAIEFLKKSAEGGYGRSANEMGNIYYNNENYKEAARWYRLGADLNNDRAAYNLAGMYRVGEGVTQDYAEAAKWYTKAAELGDSRAMNWIAFFYYKGYGAKQDYEKAMEWWKKGAEEGNGNCANWVGDLYRDGEGVKQNYAEAIMWYSKGAELGDGYSMNQLGLRYDAGQGVEKDKVKAVYWFRKAAEAGYDWGMNNLGNMYRDGAGVYKDIEEARKWYQMAADLGNETAAESLKKLL